MDRRCLLPALMFAISVGVSPVVAQVAAPPVVTSDAAKPLVVPQAKSFNAAPSTRDAIVARLIANLMPKHHISSQNLNDELSRRAMDLYLDSLDPLKLYFYQSDVDQFQTRATSIDEMVRAGDLSLAYDVFRLFTQRVDEHVGVAQELLGTEFDFTREESIIIDPDNAEYAKTPADARDRWRRQIKFALLDLKEQDQADAEDAKDKKDADKTPMEVDDPIDRLKRRYARYARRWNQTDSDDILEMYLTAVTMGYDPHSTYMSPGTLDDFSIQMRLNLDGIGAALREKDGKTVVTSVIPGGAADLHGELKELSLIHISEPTRPY